MSDGSQWRPIKTAPRATNGSKILVCSNEWFYDVEVVEWADWKAGWWNGHVGFKADDFTHWMPLPKEPKAQE